MSKTRSVLGISAPTPRMTRSAALLIAVALSIPTFALLNLLDWWLF